MRERSGRFSALTFQVIDPRRPRPQWLFNHEQDCRMTDKKWAFEDFAVGDTIALGEKQVSAGEIVEFAG